MTLPPLPDPAVPHSQLVDGALNGVFGPLFSAGQMHAYARAAVDQYGQTLWNACAQTGEVERNKLRARLMEMHERDKDRHNYWHCAVVELFGA